MGIKRRLRLRRARDFERVWRQGRRVRHRLLYLIVAPNELAHNRYGFAVGKKVGRATVRNRVKRRLREIVRAHNAHLRQGYDVILVARPESAGHSFNELASILSYLWVEAGLSDEPLC